ncbi:hypothetical protein scyTo_0019687, partial [Scyliorhinus torazame]|nr:hypothetical protein [Scyliorhinus torazame]
NTKNIMERLGESDEEDEYRDNLDDDDHPPKKSKAKEVVPKIDQL